MTVGIVGLGLIGGSFAKAIKKNTEHTVLGLDIDESVIERAKLLGVIDGVMTPDDLHLCDLVLISLYPDAIIDFLNNNADKFAKNSLVIDCGGIKREICAVGNRLANENGFCFIGGHPMAGREVWGFRSAQLSLFNGASMILTPNGGIDISILAQAKQFFLSIGFGTVTIRTPEEHDEIIAYTSQLAHVLSSAYIKSPTAAKHRGLSAGSFKDMTRVAFINDKMWSGIFVKNKDHLVGEIDVLIDNLNEYRNAIENGDIKKIESLLAHGSELKKQYFSKE